MGATRIPLDISEVLEEPTFDEMVEFIKTIASLGIAQDKLRFALANALKLIHERFPELPESAILGLLVGPDTYELMMPLTGLSGQFMGLKMTPSKDVIEGSVELVVDLPERSDDA